MAFTDPILVIAICITIIRPALAVGSFEFTDVCKTKPCPAGQKFHCLVDENWKQGQICLEHRMISKGKCPYYNTYQGNLDVRPCMTILDIEACPSAPYQSYDGSKYSGCMMDYSNMNVVIGVTTSKNTTVSMTTDPLIMPPTTKIVETNETGAALGSSEEKNRYSYPSGTRPVKPYVVALALMPCCIVVISLIIVLYKRNRIIRRCIKRSEYDLEENVNRDEQEREHMLNDAETSQKETSHESAAVMDKSKLLGNKQFVNKDQSESKQMPNNETLHIKMEPTTVTDINEEKKSQNSDDTFHDASQDTVSSKMKDTDDSYNRSADANNSVDKMEEEVGQNEGKESWTSCTSLNKDEKPKGEQLNDHDGKVEIAKKENMKGSETVPSGVTSTLNGQESEVTDSNNLEKKTKSEEEKDEFRSLNDNNTSKHVSPSKMVTVNFNIEKNGTESLSAKLNVKSITTPTKMSDKESARPLKSTSYDTISCTETAQASANDDGVNLGNYYVDRNKEHKKDKPLSKEIKSGEESKSENSESKTPHGQWKDEFEELGKFDFSQDDNVNKKGQLPDEDVTLSDDTSADGGRYITQSPEADISHEEENELGKNENLSDEKAAISVKTNDTLKDKNRSKTLNIPQKRPEYVANDDEPNKGKGLGENEILDKDKRESTHL